MEIWSRVHWAGPGHPTGVKVDCGMWNRRGDEQRQAAAESMEHRDE